MASDSDKPTDFSATDSALGYLYQIRLGLLSSLRRLSRDASFTIYFETLDDVVFEEAGTPAELLQLKHHCERAANLTERAQTSGRPCASGWRVAPTARSPLTASSSWSRPVLSARGPQRACCWPRSAM